MENAMYREWVPADKLVRSMVGFVTSLLAFVLFVITVFEISLALVITILVISFAFVGFLVRNYRSLGINMNIVNYGFHNRKRVHLTEIGSCKHIKASLEIWKCRYKMGINGSRDYTIFLGDAIKLNLQRGCLFLFSLHNPIRLAN
jgi:hypothetical protein